MGDPVIANHTLQLALRVIAGPRLPPDCAFQAFLPGTDRTRGALHRLCQPMATIHPGLRSRLPTRLPENPHVCWRSLRFRTGFTSVRSLCFQTGPTIWHVMHLARKKALVSLSRGTIGREAAFRAAQLLPGCLMRDALPHLGRPPIRCHRALGIVVPTTGIRNKWEALLGSSTIAASSCVRRACKHRTPWSLPHLQVVIHSLDGCPTALGRGSPTFRWKTRHSPILDRVARTQET